MVMVNLLRDSLRVRLKYPVLQVYPMEADGRDGGDRGIENREIPAEVDEGDNEQTGTTVMLRGKC
jgi:hypothetical protein